MDFFQSLYASDPTYSPLTIGVSLAVSIVAIVAYWNIFNKAGQPGWKAIIPIYNFYILYKIAWKGVWFALTMICSLTSSVLLTLWYMSLLQDPTTGSWMFFAALFLLLVVSVVSIVLNFKLAKAFGHGVGFGLGLTFLYPIFLLILAFGNSAYAARKNSAEGTYSADARQGRERNKPKNFKDFFYDKNDIIVVLIIVAVAGLIIYTRIGAIMDYPEVLAKQNAATETTSKTATEPTSEANDASNPSGESDGTSTAAGTVSVEITDSDTSATVADKLKAAGLVSSDAEFENYVKSMGKTGSLKTGTFQIPSGSSSEEILKIIAD